MATNEFGSGEKVWEDYHTSTFYREFPQKFLTEVHL